MAIDTHGNVLIQEDPGNVNHLARIVAYRISDGALGVVAKFDANLFDRCHSRRDQVHDRRGVERHHRRRGHSSAPERSSSMPRSTREAPPGPPGPGTVQEFVENGQYLMLKVDDWSAVYGD